MVRQRRKIMDNDFRDKKYTFFQHKECEFFPCHKTNKPEDFNCLFCYCPLYALGNRCGGNFIYTESGFKDCTNCIFPHVRDNYPKILERYQDIIQVAQEQNK
ncbi:metal-binding protein [Eubacterium minutum ATCC 700079]|nr:metal-binding protein [Eubacterium minutum ATCC 700079]